MNREELLKAANDASPFLMKKVATMLYLTERVSPEHGQEAAEGIAAILDRAADGLEKTSADAAKSSKFMDFASTPGGGVVLGAAATVVGALGSTISSDMYEWSKKKLTEGSNFRRILKANPHLEESFSKDELKKAFSTLHRYGPEFTADPHLGGQILFAVTKNPENLFTTVEKQLIPGRKSISEHKQRQFAPRFELGESLNRSVDRAIQKQQDDLRAEQFGQTFQQRALQISDQKEENKTRATTQASQFKEQQESRKSENLRREAWDAKKTRMQATARAAEEARKSKERTQSEHTRRQAAEHTEGVRRRHATGMEDTKLQKKKDYKNWEVLVHPRGPKKS